MTTQTTQRTVPTPDGRVLDPADMSVPLLLLHGRQDLFVPFGHGQWLAARA